MKRNHHKGVQRLMSFDDYPDVPDDRQLAIYRPVTLEPDAVKRLKSVQEYIFGRVEKAAAASSRIRKIGNEALRATIVPTSGYAGVERRLRMKPIIADACKLLLAGMPDITGTAELMQGVHGGHGSLVTQGENQMFGIGLADDRLAREQRIAADALGIPSYMAPYVSLVEATGISPQAADGIRQAVSEVAPLIAVDLQPLRVDVGHNTYR